MSLANRLSLIFCFGLHHLLREISDTLVVKCFIMFISLSLILSVPGFIKAFLVKIVNLWARNHSIQPWGPAESCDNFPLVCFQYDPGSYNYPQFSSVVRAFFPGGSLFSGERCSRLWVSALWQKEQVSRGRDDSLCFMCLSSISAVLRCYDLLI